MNMLTEEEILSLRQDLKDSFATFNKYIVDVEPLTLRDGVVENKEKKKEEE